MGQVRLYAYCTVNYCRRITDSILDKTVVDSFFSMAISSIAYSVFIYTLYIFFTTRVENNKTDKQPEKKLN